MSSEIAMSIDITDIRRLVERILHRDELLANARSPFGEQIERLANAKVQAPRDFEVMPHAISTLQDRKGMRATEKAGYHWA